VIGIYIKQNLEMIQPFMSNWYQISCSWNSWEKFAIATICSAILIQKYSRSLSCFVL